MSDEASRNKRRVAIVGAGPGGLTSAMILAHRGVEVDVYERKGHVGGRNACLEVGPYKFDVGPTFLMMRYILDEAFEEAGARGADYLEFVRLDPMYRLVFDRFALNCTPDVQKMREEIAHAAPGHEDAIVRFMTGEGRRFSYMAPCLQQPYGSLRSLFTKNLLKALPHLSLGRRVFDILEGYFGDPDLALAFSFQSKYLGMSPWECPGAFAMLAYIEYAFGVYHTMGGLSEISRAMATVAEGNGARIHLSTPVESLIVRDGAVRGVALEGGEKREYGDTIVNADFAHAATTIFPEGSLRKYSPRQLETKKLSCSTFMLYLGLDKIYDLPHHSIYMAKSYRRNVEDIFVRRRLSEDTSFYIRNASVTDPTLAPQGHSAMYVLVPVANLRAGIDWQREKEPFRRRVLDTIARRTGIADLESHIREERVITPEDWENEYSVYRGATFNLAHTFMQMLYFRPHNKFEEVDHCYLVGGGTHPGSGVPTIIESGRIAANLICRHRGIPYTSKNVFA